MKKIISVFTTAFSIFIILLACVIVFPILMGYKNYTVLSGSMEPNIHVGSLAYVKQSTADEIKENDIITFKLDEQTVATHRVIKIDNEKKQFITKGDANKDIDINPTAFRNVIGKCMFSIPLLGYLAMKIQTKLGIVVVCLVLIAIVLAIFIPMILKKEEVPQEK